MYLKKVEIQGFKSFAEKTEVEFNSKVTAIVGPNGSGKSNIADAIRWVLGEQSVKSLRGLRMEDIIFSGTEKRRALGFSEVTITFDNASGKIPVDYSEVAVTRRMFRSGESEYYINKNSCRLKDVRELFMDTGVGKEGYSIIGQGKIDEILSNKPEDRRNIFEEAAGIIKYKTRKSESLRKLEKTESNISRIGDLLHEVGSQKEILKAESEKASEFQKLFGKMRDLDLAIASREIKRMRTSLDKQEEKEIELTSEKEILGAEFDNFEAHFGRVRESVSEIETLIEQKRTLKLESFQNLENSKNSVKILQEKENYLARELERTEEDISRLLIEIESMKESVFADKSILMELESSISDHDKEIENLLVDRQDSIELVKNKESIIEELRMRIADVQNKVIEKRSQAGTLISYRESLNKKKAQFNEDLAKSETELNKFEEKKLKLIDQYSLNKSLLHESNRLYNAVKNKLTYINKKISEVENTKSILDKKLHNANTSLTLYKGLESDYEGYYGSVKALIKKINSDSGFSRGYKGIVSELFDVEKEYLKAVETALGNSIQNIVVDDEASAKRMIEYLKVEKKGRATFLPLSTVTGGEISLSSELQKSKGYIGTASRLVKYDAKYEGVFKYLLGRTLVFDNIDNALAFAKNTGFKYRIITLEAEVINAGGSITGGSAANGNNGLLSRKHNISALENEIRDISKDLNTIKNEIENYTAKSIELKNDYERLSNEKNLLDSKSKDLEHKAALITVQYNKHVKDIESKRVEIEELDNELLSLETKESIVTAEEGDIESIINTSTRELKQLESEIENLRQLKYSSDEKINEIRLIKSVAMNKIESLKTQGEEKSTSIDKKLSLIEEKKAEKHRLDDEIESLSNSLQNLNSQIEEHRLYEEQEASGLEELLAEKEVRMNNFYDLQEKNRILTQRLSKVEREVNKLEIDRTRFNLQIENITERILLDYDISEEEILSSDYELGGIREEQQTLSELRSAIKVLGIVNIGAIEDYRNASERYEFLSAQLTDLNAAREDIQSVIRDMEKRMRVQFRKSFDEINTNFSEIFAVLFSGGKARLELDEEEDILSSGIEIMAQPPGKKLQNLMLLSGGEKSLTAVALLFAILKTKPSPFCVLDEIDAALDEANIGRYTNYLKGFDDETQFVLITHRKTTMEIADMLYGVTMEEEGVSRLISLRLRDYSEATG